MSCGKVPGTGLSPGEQGLKGADQPAFPSPRVVGTFVYILSCGWRPHTDTTQARLLSVVGVTDPWSVHWEH